MSAREPSKYLRGEALSKHIKEILGTSAEPITPEAVETPNQKLREVELSPSEWEILYRAGLRLDQPT